MYTQKKWAIGALVVILVGFSLLYVLLLNNGSKNDDDEKLYQQQQIQRQQEQNKIAQQLLEQNKLLKDALAKMGQVNEKLLRVKMEEASLRKELEEKSATSKHRPPKNVFFDLGANNGDSVGGFVGMGQSHGIVSDGDGVDIEGLGSKGIWDIWVFEPNPRFTSRLKQIAAKIRSMGHTVHLMTESVAYVRDGQETFFLDVVNSALGSSLYKDHRDVVASNFKNVTVKSVDIARVLRTYYTPQDNVVIKVDIEGAEYELLAHLMKTGTLSLVDTLGVEFHDFLQPEEGIIPGIEYLIRQFGVKLGKWG